jgi:hypothetical protein
MDVALFRTLCVQHDCPDSLAHRFASASASLYDKPDARPLPPVSARLLAPSRKPAVPHVPLTTLSPRPAPSASPEDAAEGSPRESHLQMTRTTELLIDWVDEYVGRLAHGRKYVMDKRRQRRQLRALERAEAEKRQALLAQQNAAKESSGEGCRQAEARRMYQLIHST